MQSLGLCPRDCIRSNASGREHGQAAILLVGGMCAALLLAVVLGGVARGIGVRSHAQSAADLAALAGARAMLDAYPRLFAAPDDPGHLEKRAYLELGEAAARDVARRNGADARVDFPDDQTIAPVRIRVRVTEQFSARRGDAEAHTPVTASAEAELSPSATGAGYATGGGYSGPLAHRQGKPMRPDVAMAFDRMAAAARRDGVALLITSAFRSDAEQAILWARRPDPRWVAPPGKSLHRNGTELDLGPPATYGWLAANAQRFHFLRRYPWEPWHFGFVLNASSTPPPAPDDHAEHGRIPVPGSDRKPLPDFVPAEFAKPIARAAQRWNVSGILLAAQLYAESGFNPFARSGAGAQGIAQFMPGTARAYGLANPFDPEQAIDAQARLMRDLLRQFGSVPLALAAYNAGPGPVAACACVPPYPETRGYVARILGLMGGAGDMAGGAGGLSVRLVR
jgi:LAS superfamily LD-carboxypeptidase LdcB